MPGCSPTSAVIGYAGVSTTEQALHVCKGGTRDGSSATSTPPEPPLLEREPASRNHASLDRLMVRTSFSSPHCYTPADTTVPARAGPCAVPRAARRRRKRTCLRRVASTSGCHTVAVSRWRMSMCQRKFERL
jgi:hypothetical protein